MKNNPLLIKLKDVLDYELKWDLTKGLKETIPYYEQACMFSRLLNNDFKKSTSFHSQTLELNKR